MSLHTFDVSAHEGRVCYVTQQGESFNVTIECYDRNVAFHIRHSSRPLMHVGDWVRVRGKVRFDPGIGRDGRPHERNLGYYHVPHDGSMREHWMFFELLESDAELLGPPDVMEKLYSGTTALRRHTEGWTKNNNVESLRETLRALDDARDVLQIELRKRAIEQEELNVPVAALSLDID